MQRAPLKTGGHKEGDIMIFKGKIDTWWYIATAFLNGIAIAAVIYDGLSTILLANVLLVVVADLYFIPVIFKNEAKITKKEVIVTFGLLTKTIPIQSITRVKIQKSYNASFAASFYRIGIEARGLSAVFIALEDNESFVKELMRKNRKIKYLM